MKNLKNLLLITVLMIGSASAFAEVLTAHLENYMLDGSFDTKGKKITATVTVDLEGETSRLEIFGKKICPKDMLCTQEIEILADETLPLIDVRKTEVGMTYLASLNELPVDGAKKTILITDFKKEYSPGQTLPLRVYYTVEFYSRLSQEKRRQFSVLIGENLKAQ